MRATQNRRALFVDDEPHVLEAIQRKLGDEFEIETAIGGASGLALLDQATLPFAVIVSDMRMPDMDGAAFLARTRGLSSTSTRMLLTGDTDLKSAISAVNDGHIFRFLCKPCPSEVLKSALEAGIEQHALVIAERDIMERTLSGVVKTLADVLAIADPALFNRTTQVKAYVSHVVQRLALEGAWQIEVAASLHTLGLIALPVELAHRTPNGPSLNAQQKKQLATHPETTQRILEAIPRLEEVALIVGQQAVEATQGPEWLRSGARLLRLASRLEARVSRGAALGDALDSLEPSASEEERAYLNALRGLLSDSARMETKDLRVRDLVKGMVLESDVHTLDGTLVLTRGRELNAVLLERLRQFAASRGLHEPVHVRIPAPASSPGARTAAR